MLSMDNYRPNFTQGNFLLFIFHLFSSNQSLKQGYITQNSTFKFFFTTKSAKSYYGARGDISG